MNQVSELIIAKNSLVSLSMTGENKEDQVQTFQEQIEYLERITTNLHESVMKVRMVPIESVVNKFPRMIRDLSKRLNKKMELEMTGEDTELDRTVVDQLGDPLQHLLRNSADHGLESAELRKERGKSEVGTIFLKAFQEGNNVIIEVGDDGNGIDTESYNPETDYQLYRNYSKDDMSGKGECKRALQERLCLEQRWDVPLVGMVTRLVAHKGLDLVRMGLEELMDTENMQFVILGSGDKEYEDYFNYMQAKYPGRLCFCHGFVPELARKIYSGADIFLMPSAQEPCGLAQMIALRYGTIPVVREVGGLKDSVFDSADNYGNGFTFKNYECADMQLAVRRALWGIQDDQGWHQLMWRAMMSDNSWERSAQDYINLYNDTLKWA